MHVWNSGEIGGIKVSHCEFGRKYTLELQQDYGRYHHDFAKLTAYTKSFERSFVSFSDFRRTWDLFESHFMASISMQVSDMNGDI